MSDKNNPELKKHSFEAEVAQLLHLVTHSLYSNADIFVRELVSNASDACDKLRFEATNDDSLYEDDGELKIRIAVDSDAKTITFIDNGIGMNEADALGFRPQNRSGGIWPSRPPHAWRRGPGSLPRPLAAL